MAGEALTDLSDVINRVTGGNSGTPETIFWYKDPRVGAAAATAQVAGLLWSLWQFNGVPSGGVAPSSVAIPDNDLAGGLRQTDPAGGRKKRLLGMTAASMNAGTLILYDRLLHIGGLNGTTLTAQTVGGTLTRYTDGAGNQIWVEINTALGSTGTTISAAYTDQGGDAGTTAAAVIGGTNYREAQRMIVLPLATGDSGVQGVTSVTLAGTTGTAGDFGVVIAHPLLHIPLSLAGVGVARDLIAGLPNITEILTDACLALAWIPNTAAAPAVCGSLTMIEK